MNELKRMCELASLNESTDLGELDALLKQHDWFYEYSNGKQYKSGVESLAKIRKAINQLNPDDSKSAEKAWNKYAKDGSKFPSKLIGASIF